jgi:methionyl-tRNA formyltransferase
MSQVGYPGAWSSWKGQRVRIWEAEPVDPAPTYEGRIAGRVVRFNDETADVLSGDGVLKIHWVQLEGDGARRAGEVLRSVKTSLA